MNRQGSITRIKTGFWLRMHINGKRASCGVYATEDAADEVRRAMVQKMAAAGDSGTAGVSLRVFGPRVLDEREIEGVRDVDGERSIWRTHIETAAFIDDPVDAISPPIVDAWARALQKKKTATPRHTPRTIKRKTVRGAVRLLSLIFKRAIVLGLVSANPCDAIKVRSEPTVTEPWTYLLPEEQTALLTCEAIPEVDRVTMAFALGTGLRAGEQFGLRLADLHVDGDNPRIVVRYGSKHKGTKSGKVKEIPLFGIALDAARRWLELLPAFTRDAKGRGHNDLGLVFPGRRGGHRGLGKNLHGSRTVDGVTLKVDFFREHLVAAGIVAAKRHDGRLPRWHDLRHTCASSLVAGWWGRPWSLEEVCAYLRHSSITVTQRYAHLGQTALRAAASATPGGLRAGYESAPSDRANPLFSSSGSTGTRTPDQRVKRADDSPAISLSYEARNLAITSLRALARRDSAAAHEAGRALAELVLGEPAARAATAVLEGGEHLDHRIADLAAAVLDAVEHAPRRAQLG